MALGTIVVYYGLEALPRPEPPRPDLRYGRFIERTGAYIEVACPPDALGLPQRELPVLRQLAAQLPSMSR